MNMVAWKMLKSKYTTIRDDVRKKLYDRFIEPTTHGKKDFVGIEVEMPIINLDKKAVDFVVVHQVTAQFQKSFKIFQYQTIDHDGHVCSLINKDNGDIISYDCSYNNIEFSFGKEVNLYDVYERFKIYYNFFKDEFGKYNHTLTGMGINPYRIYNNHIPIPNERYQMLYHHLCTYSRYSKLPKYFHEHPEYGMFASSSQVQLDVEYDDLIKTINVFNKLEPLKALLFSNSVLLGENENLLCCRDMLWRDSTHGINPHNIGMYETELESMEDLKAYLESLNIYCTMRDGAYINFPTINIMEYFNQDEIEGEYCTQQEYKDIIIKPQLDDIEYLRTFKFLDLTYRGTIEYRSCCTQPIEDVLTVAAFQLGLKHNLDKLGHLLENDRVIYHQGYNPTELRKFFVQKELPGFINEDELYQLLHDVVELSFEGLEKRGYGEEVFLSPLYNRIDERTNPAKQMLDLLDKDFTLEEIIIQYGKLE